MAEGTSDNSSWESWLGGWVQAAKEKSSTAYEFVKKDLAEFTTTVQQETEKAIEKTSSTLTRENTEQATTKVKEGISSILGNISKALVIPPSDEYVPVIVSKDGTTLYDRGKARLHAIQLDVSTYADTPRGSKEQFEMWLTSFDMDQHKGEISEILVSKVEVRALYTKLVPNDVSHAEFWQRYFYRVHQMECDEARKQALMQRADRSKHDSLSWDDDEWSDGDDEGNQSDWEKMPRPQQQTSGHYSKDAKSAHPHSTDPDPVSSSPHTPTDLGPQQTDTSSTEAKDNVTKTKPAQLEIIADNSAGAPSFETDSTHSPNNLPTVYNHFSNDYVSPSSDEAQSIPQPFNASFDTPATASAGTNETVHLQQFSQMEEPGSPSEVSNSFVINEESTNPIPHSLDQPASSAAAASSAELPFVPDDRNVTMGLGDAACGAEDVVLSPPVVSLPSDNGASLTSTSEDPEIMPQASNSVESSVPQSNVEHADGTQLSLNHELNVETNNDIQPKDEHNADEIAMRVKGDMVVVGETGTPSSGSSEGKGLEDDWEEDFDVELTEEDLKAAEDIAKRLGENLEMEDDWENWD